MKICPPFRIAIYAPSFEGFDGFYHCIGSNIGSTLYATLTRRGSVMQSDGNSFCGDVVLDSFNMAYRDENSIICRPNYEGILWLLLLSVLVVL